MYMATESGIPEIKTVLSSFVIPHFLDFNILVVKAVGSIFAVSSGMCLGKEGPFVHISASVSYLVAMRFSKYRDNGREMREILAAGVATGLSAAFAAPIGGVLFAYEEISTYFPRKVLWRVFICSLCAAMTLKTLNPSGTGKSSCSKRIMVQLMKPVIILYSPSLVLQVASLVASQQG